MRAKGRTVMVTAAIVAGKFVFQFCSSLFKYGHELEFRKADVSF